LTPTLTYDQVDHLNDYISNYKTVELLSMVTLLITIYEIILILNLLVPSFGLLIYTFVVARKDILIFLCVKNYTKLFLVYIFTFN
jgi:hypothetical protein